MFFGVMSVCIVMSVCRNVYVYRGNKRISSVPFQTCLQYPEASCRAESWGHRYSRSMYPLLHDGGGGILQGRHDTTGGAGAPAGRPTVGISQVVKFLRGKGEEALHSGKLGLRVMLLGIVWSDSSRHVVVREELPGPSLARAPVA